jgi:hypothetical protein
MPHARLRAIGRYHNHPPYLLHYVNKRFNSMCGYTIVVYYQDGGFLIIHQTDQFFCLYPAKVVILQVGCGIK